MIDINFHKKDLDSLQKKLSLKGSDVDLHELMLSVEQKNSLQVDLDDLKNKKNRMSKEIGILAKKNEDISDLKKQSEEISNSITKIQNEYDDLSAQINVVLLNIPNIPDDDVPQGDDESANLEINTNIFKQNRDGLDHTEIGQRLGLLDFEAANKLTGSRFVVLKGKLAELQRALITFMLNEAKNNGFEEVYVPYIVNAESLIGTGQLPKFEEDQFKINADRYLIPTAEVPLTNLYRNEVLDESNLPVKITAHTPCFRAEAGSYGKDTKGMIRQHQFEKVEIVMVVEPKDSDKALNELVKYATTILDKLEISYRNVVLCTGDLGFSAAKTVDIEVWLPSQNCFREISSCSNFRDFQSRRMNFKIKSEKNKYFPHTLNGSALAVGRTLLAILENNYENGVGVYIPKVLRNYLDFDLIEEKNK
tara:strand:+ start:38732 stop:39994 length:1263 start_codon:yes stop_codon:yes gene_type:complete